MFFGLVVVLVRVVDHHQSVCTPHLGCPSPAATGAALLIRHHLSTLHCRDDQAKSQLRAAVHDVGRAVPPPLHRQPLETDAVRSLPPLLCCVKMRQPQTASVRCWERGWCWAARAPFRAGRRAERSGGNRQQLVAFGLLVILPAQSRARNILVGFK